MYIVVCNAEPDAGVHAKEAELKNIRLLRLKPYYHETKSTSSHPRDVHPRPDGRGNPFRLLRCY